MRNAEYLSDAMSAARIAAGVLSPRFTRDIESQRKVYKGFIAHELTLPVNVEEDLLNSVVGIVNERDLASKNIDYKTPYWDKDLRYNPFQMFGALIQYIDFHDESLPVTVLPPQEDVDRYIGEVLNSRETLTIPQQMEKLLDITQDNIVGAANLGFIASRLVARTYDRTAYPAIDTSPDVGNQWNRKIAQFEVYEKNAQIDGPGDTYYFWTHMFAGLGLSKLEGRTPEFINSFFTNGTQTMRFVREHIARRPTLSRHEEASLLGRNLGLAVAEMI